MSDIGEAFGSAVQGGLFARAIEPHSGAKSAHPNQPENCENCGTPLQGAYCHACGQRGHIHRTIGGFMHELLHGALHFEGKLWRTLPMLVFKPGQLTRRYIDGQRARFVSPMALFLFSIFLMFAIFQLAGITAPTEIKGNQAEQLRELAISEVTRLEAKQDELNAQLAEGDLEPGERQQLQVELQQVERELEGIASAQEEIPFLAGVTEAADKADEPAAEEPTPDSEERDTVIDLSEDKTAKMTVGSSDVAFVEAAVDKWRKNPGLMLYKLQANFYKFSWLLIPLSIPFVWLLFAWKRRFKAYDHAIFVTYSLSFMTLLIITATLLGVAGAPSVAVISLLMTVPPLHLYKHLRKTYEIGRFSTIWRLLVLSSFIVVILMIFLQILILLGAF
ncbi:DUF3667 domain-containing protein [Erythrobacter sp. HKB08]|uniref:DUF3667 domain-containing protein n=1 Tax=Erythrobacter sp. HKB08 TaxID=2502843 RepID=UPI001008A659|nr:DUF3667 domain-containing protein [Erythrobacter sp. HKB08]